MRGSDAVLHEMRDFGAIGRDGVRRATVHAALDLLLARIERGEAPVEIPRVPLR